MAKSTIMMPFFLAMPMSKRIPKIAITLILSPTAINSGTATHHSRWGSRILSALSNGRFAAIAPKQLMPSFIGTRVTCSRLVAAEYRDELAQTQFDQRDNLCRRRPAHQPAHYSGGRGGRRRQSAC